MMVIKTRILLTLGLGHKKHVYFKQTLFGLDIDNSDCNVNVRGFLLKCTSHRDDLEIVMLMSGYVLDCQRWLCVLVRQQLLHRRCS